MSPRLAKLDGSAVVSPIRSATQFIVQEVRPVSQIVLIYLTAHIKHHVC